MGFESYNFRLYVLDNTDICVVINSFLKMGYTILENNTLEKSLKSGFIEVMVNQKDVSIRTAKANDEDIINEIIEDVKKLKDIVKIRVFDLQMKQKVSLEHLSEIFENFSLLHNEFYQQYPNVKPPIRCSEIFR